MPKFPEPPAAKELAVVRPEWVTLEEGTPLWRVYMRGGAHPSSWDTLRDYGPLSGRFDHHLPPRKKQKRAIMYAAEHGPTCLAEVYQDSRLIDSNSRVPWIAGFYLCAPLTLLDVSGVWSTRSGCSTALSSGPRPRAQRWSQVIYEAYPSGQGIYYSSSMNGGKPAFAVLERGRACIPDVPFCNRALSDPSVKPMVLAAATSFGYAVL